MASEFGSSTENEALKGAIIARIEREDGITFLDFMAMALYEPGLGYYCSPGTKMGREGDYLTSPEVSPVFGAMVGRQLREMWGVLGRPGRFNVTEVGAGNGTLCHDILRWVRRAAPEMRGAIEYIIVEPLPVIEARQRELIGAESLEARVMWTPELPQGIEGCIVTNELLDSMPVHRVATDDARLRELFVTWDGERFTEALREPSTAEIEKYFMRLDVFPGEGCTAEVNLEAPRWMKRAASALTRGFVLTFDYGYGADELYAPWRKDGTLLCFYRHNPSGDPYARVGRQDITSHVDFTSLRRSGDEAGMQTVGFVSQAEFLVNIGIGETLPPAEGEIDLEERLARRRAVSELLDPAGLGRIKVLAQAKAVDSAHLRGFAGDA
ncbi:MAG TPA: SAM-dependent methyltransferase [Dehalococcoidia bacterium]|nr:SAM-dependent methyltransferase [Dehalococcoidia bacterium]